MRAKSLLFAFFAFFAFSFLTMQLCFAYDFGPYVTCHFNPAIWEKEDFADSHIPYVGLTGKQLSFVVGQVKSGTYPLTPPPEKCSDESVTVQVFKRASRRINVYLVAARMKSNVPPKTLRRRLFRRLDFLLPNKVDITKRALRIADEAESGLSLTTPNAAFKSTIHSSRAAHKPCWSSWFFYTNPGAKAAFKPRKGEFTVLWAVAPTTLVYHTFLERWTEVNTEIDFSDSQHDIFEKGEYLPFSSLLAGREDGDWTSFRAASSSYLLTMGITFGIKYTVRAERPNGHGNVSFPSAHTSSAFSAVGSLGYLHPKTKLPLFALGIMTARSRVRSMDHTVFDTFVGALIGYFVGKQVGRRMKRLDNYSNNPKTISLHTLRF